MYRFHGNRTFHSVVLFDFGFCILCMFYVCKSAHQCVILFDIALSTLLVEVARGIGRIE